MKQYTFLPISEAKTISFTVKAQHLLYSEYYGSTKPVLVTIPFSSFVGRDNKSAVFDPGKIESFGLWSNAIVPEGVDESTYKLESVLYYDSIKAVSSNVKNVTFTRTNKLDVHRDGAINLMDIMELARAFNSARGDKKYIADYDLNGDGAVNMQDIMIIAAEFNTII